MGVMDCHMGGFGLDAIASECEFRFNPAGDSDLIPATIPI
jgi:hypothetical protein